MDTLGQCGNFISVSFCGHLILRLQVVGLRASTNNRASTVLDIFLDAIEEYGIPSRVRGDRGPENKDVSILMILLRGLNRASFMWGSSTFNTRIERLWVDVGTQFARRWRAFFFQLEHLHNLDRKDPAHLWLLHHLFLDNINIDCKEFQNNWNSKPISGEGHDQSPNVCNCCSLEHKFSSYVTFHFTWQDMRFLGQTLHGIYVDDCEGVHPDVINRYYGVDGAPWQSVYRSGAGMLRDEGDFDEDSYSDVDGDPMNEDADDWEDVQDQLAEDIEANFNHLPIDVPKHSAPFHTQLAADIFTGALNELQVNQIIPIGFGMTPAEWGNEGYPSYEIIRTGRRARKELRINLPDFIWRPRAELWVQALHILLRVIDMDQDGHTQ
jgi:hypothetical protein